MVSYLKKRSWVEKHACMSWNKWCYDFFEYKSGFYVENWSRNCTSVAVAHGEGIVVWSGNKNHGRDGDSCETGRKSRGFRFRPKQWYNFSFLFKIGGDTLYRLNFDNLSRYRVSGSFWWLLKKSREAMTDESPNQPPCDQANFGSTNNNLTQARWMLPCVRLLWVTLAVYRRSVVRSALVLSTWASPNIIHLQHILTMYSRHS